MSMSYINKNDFIIFNDDEINIMKILNVLIAYLNSKYKNNKK